jgi:hypothetical protein
MEAVCDAGDGPSSYMTARNYLNYSVVVVLCLLGGKMIVNYM